MFRVAFGITRLKTSLFHRLIWMLTPLLKVIMNVLSPTHALPPTWLLTEGRSGSSCNNPKSHKDHGGDSRSRAVQFPLEL